jgi:gliding motility-associated-like protein
LVSEQALPASAGTDGFLTVCAGSTPSNVELFAALTGSPASGGVWSNIGLVYTYTQSATSPCIVDNTANVTVTYDTITDTDGDGLTDCEETTGIDDPSTATVATGTSDPNDPCDPNPLAILTGDCDGDGNPNGGDPNPITATANDDSGTAPVRTTTTIDILTNDDYLDNTDLANLGTTTITQNGGTAGGTVSFDSTTETLDYTPLPGEAGTTVTVIYQVCNDASGSSVCSTATVTITVLQLDCLISYNEFSPNDDGINDTFVIECIENYPNNKLEIYNRWGNVVYSKRGYRNEFNGTSNGRVTINTSEKLPDGTYYYVLDLGDGSKPKVGWIYINR